MATTDQVTVGMHLSFNSNVAHLMQQMEAKFRPLVDTASYTGKGARAVTQYGQTEVQRLVGRVQNSLNIDVQRDARWVYPEDTVHETYIMDQDELRLLWQEKGPLTKAAAMAFNRAIDETIINAAIGTAQTGAVGSLSSTAIIGTDQQLTPGSGLTLDVLRNIRKKFSENDFEHGEDIYMAVSPVQMDDLLTIVQATNADYTINRNLDKGFVAEFMGFKFVESNLLPTDDSSRRQCFAWVKSGLHLGVWSNPSFEIDRDIAKAANPTKISGTMTIGATRLEEKKVVVASLTES